MKKKANIPVTILVIGVFVVCTLAIISFILSSINSRDSFLGVGLMEKINLQIEDYLVHQDIDAAKTTLENGKLFFYQEEEKASGYLFWKEKRIVFSVKYPADS